MLVKFKRQYNIYYSGDIASFTEELSAWLIANGIAEEYKEDKKKKD